MPVPKKKYKNTGGGGRGEQPITALFISADVRFTDDAIAFEGTWKLQAKGSRSNPELCALECGAGQEPQAPL